MQDLELVNQLKSLLTFTQFIVIPCVVFYIFIIMYNVFKGWNK